MRYLTLLVLLFSVTLADAGILPPQNREELIQAVLAGFWGKARNSAGEPIQPASEAERKTVPVSPAVVQRALDAGEISGLAAWWGLEWQGHYLTLTRAARVRGLDDKQVAFVSVLHGAAQGVIGRGMQNQTCSADDKLRVKNMLDQSQARGLGER